MSLARILMIGEDGDVAQLGRRVLEAAGYEVVGTGSGVKGLELAATYRPDVVVVDAGLSDVSELDVCASLSHSNDAFILMLSGRPEKQDVLLGLDLGADDYMIKPVSAGELVARVASFLRRREKIVTRPGGGATLQLGSSRLDRNLQTLANNGSRITLTALEFRLLWFLGEGQGRLLTRAQILESVWNDTSGVPTRVVDVHVASLRKKLATIHAPLEISSVRGIGYRLDKR